MPLAHVTFMYDLVEGSLQDAKAKLAEEITESIVRNVVHSYSGDPRDLVTIVFHDVGADDWVTGGELFSRRKASGG